MKPTKGQALKKLILLKILSQNLQQGEKINSIKELAIMHNLSTNAIKRILLKFVALNILISKPKKGFFVNDSIFEYLPLSIRQKYNLRITNTSFKKCETHNLLIKKYGNDSDLNIAWVETYLPKYFECKELLAKEKTMMQMLIEQDIVISQIASKKRFVCKEKQNFIFEERILHQAQAQDAIFEKIYIKTDYWFEKHKLVV